MAYLLMLFVVFLMSLGLGKAVQVYATSAQREREAELLEAGMAYRLAIRDYYLSAPQGQNRYPDSLEDLLKDRRHLVTRRYLRRLYLDPMTSKAFVPIWAPEGGIRGVRSGSGQEPLRTILPGALTVDPSLGSGYARWQFVFDGNSR